MQAIWTGSIGFGLVSIPVRLYAATEEHSVPLHQVHLTDGGRIRYRRVCEVDGEEVPYTEVARGYEADDGRTAVLTDDDLAELPLPSKKFIDVLAFVDLADIDPLVLDKAYYIGATKRVGAAKPYALLREALVTSGKAAVAKIALRSRESLALLRVHGEVLVLHTMHWPDEIRSDDGLAPTGRTGIRPQELKMAASLMESLSEGFDLESLHDEYATALEQLVATRLSGVRQPRGRLTGTRREDPDDVVDLTSALKESIEAREKPPEGRRAAAASGAAAGKAPAGRTGPKEAAVKKTAVKKTGAKAPAEKTDAGAATGGTAGGESAGESGE